MDTLHTCRVCATILPTSEDDTTTCAKCGAEAHWADAPDGVFERVTKSPAREEPEWVYRARKRKEEREALAAGAAPKQQENAVVEEACPACQHPLASFYTLQTRSVDEGSTVYYQCLKCKHKWTQDN